MLERWDVRTSDGGMIAVWLEGDGPPLVLVHGSTGSHKGFGPLIGELRDEFTLFAMDRRGLGASPDGPGYSAEREFGDVAAVVDAVASRTGEPVVLFGHSWGADCALGAASQLPSLRALVLFEPSLGLQVTSPAFIDRLEERLAAGDNEGVVVEMYTDIGMTEDEIAVRRAAADWPDKVAAAPTLAREFRIEQGRNWQRVSGSFAEISVPTLLITGSESPPNLAEVTSRTAAAIPNAQVRVLAGEGHFAPRSAPAVVAEVLRNWLK